MRNREKQHFDRSVRLTTANEFKFVFNDPVKTSGKFFTVLARNQSEPVRNARLGLAISKKNTKRAVDRNRLKRLIRESFRHNRLLLPGLDIVVMAKFPAASQQNDVLNKALADHWQQLVNKTHVESVKLRS